MAQAIEHSSTPRQALAQRIAAALYGVIAIMTAELAVEPGQLSYVEAVLGALLVGLAMMTTRVFVEVVKKETEIGERLPITKAGMILRDSALVMLFPSITALLIVAAALSTTKWTNLLDLVLYLGEVTIFATGFLSSYLRDGAVRPALMRGTGWMVLSLILIAAKNVM
jgi:hypothetical protein